MIIFFNATTIIQRHQRKGVLVDVYGLADSDFIYLTIDTISGASLLSVGLIRAGSLLRIVTPAPLEQYHVNIDVLDDVKHPITDFIFMAELSADQIFMADGDVELDIVNGNVVGNYDSLSGEYTFNAVADGTFNFVGNVDDGPGGAGTTIQLLSDVQGVLDFDTLPNNTNKNVTLTFAGSFLLNEVVTVHIIHGETTIGIGSTFEFVL